MPKVIKNAKEKIIIQAKRIIETDGYEFLTIRKISEDTGVSIGTIYNYFPNKSYLDFELMSLYWKDFIKEIDINSNMDFYKQLKIIYHNLKYIIQMFTGVVTELYKQNDSSLSKKHRNEMFKELSIKISELIKTKHNENIPFSYDQLSQWITMNMVMMCHMNNMEYAIFEKIIQKIFEEDING